MLFFIEVCWLKLFFRNIATNEEALNNAVFDLNFLTDGTYNMFFK